MKSKPVNKNIENHNRWLRIFILLFYVTFLITRGMAIDSIEIPQTMSLDEAIDFAQKNNTDIKTQEEQINMAKGIYIETRGNWLLNLDLTIEGERLEGLYASSSSSGNSANVANATIDAYQPLYTFGRIKNAVKGAKAYLEIQNMELESVKQSIAFEATAAYYLVLLREELIKVNDEAVKIAEEHLNTAEIRFQQGVNTQFDVTRAKVDLANRKTDLITARNDLIRARQNLNLIFNLPPDTIIQLTDKLNYRAYTPESNKMWELAQENRPDLKALKLQIDQYQAAVQVYKAQYYPTIAAGGNYTWTQNDYEDSDKYNYDSWMGYLKLTMPIFDGFKIAGQVNQKKAQLEQAKLAYQKGMITAQSDIERAIREINQQKELVSATLETIELAEISLKMARVSYENGRATTLDVSDAEQSLRTARADNASAVSYYLIALARLKQVVGIGELPS